MLPEKKSVSELTTNILSSDEFDELAVDVNELEVSSAHFSDAEGLGVVIPFKGHEGKKFVMTLVNEKHRSEKSWCSKQLPKFSLSSSTNRSRTNNLKVHLSLLTDRGLSELIFETPKSFQARSSKVCPRKLLAQNAVI